MCLRENRRPSRWSWCWSSSCCSSSPAGVQSSSSMSSHRSIFSEMVTQALQNTPRISKQHSVFYLTQTGNFLQDLFDSRKLTMSILPAVSIRLSMDLCRNIFAEVFLWVFAWNKIFLWLPALQIITLLESTSWIIHLPLSRRETLRVGGARLPPAPVQLKMVIAARREENFNS